MRGPALAAAACLALALGAQTALRRAAPVFPPLSSLPGTPFTLQDAVLASAGFRAAAADLAWMELLQYTAGSLAEVRDEHRPYEHIKELSLRVARLDPAFHRSYLFAAGILAWFHGVDRPDDAVEILREGMRNDPGDPHYAVYIAAIAYKKRGDVDRMVALLEAIAQDPESPIEMKAILANLYKSRKEYAKALEIWDGILEHESEAREWPRARIQEAELKKLLKTRR